MMKVEAVCLLLVHCANVVKSDAYNFVVGTGDFAHSPTELAHLFQLDFDAAPQMLKVRRAILPCLGWGRGLHVCVYAGLCA